MTPALPADLPFPTLPLGRFSTPEDLGHAAAFVCGDAASPITGVGLAIDGGRCI